MLRKLLSVCACVSISFASASAQAQLVGLWRFEDGTAKDSSTFLNNGTFQNGATTTTTTTPGAFSVRSLQVGGGGGGQTQHVLVPDSSSLDITGGTGMTISAWVRPVGGFGWDAVLAKSPEDGGSTNHAGNYELRIENGTRVPTFLYEQTIGGPNDTVAGAGTSAIPNDVWTHVAVTAIDAGANTQMQFYVNGVLTNTVLGTDNFGDTNNNPLFIGTRADLFITMDGFLDDVAIFNRVLTAAEINQIRTGNFTAFGVDVPEPASIAVWVIGALGVGGVFALRAWRKRRAA